MESSNTEQILTVPIQSIENENLLNVVTFLGHANLVFNNGIVTLAETENVFSVTNKTDVKKGPIYVCTFCQVFSTSDSAIANHISKEHKSYLIEGTMVENYVSKLQELKEEKVKTKKVGRPRKTDSKRCNFDCSVSETKTIAPTPQKGPDGLYWCKKCHKHFQKPRQFTVHVCFSTDAQEELVSSETELDDDITSDFKTHMHVVQSPWSRRKKKKKENMTSVQSLKSAETLSINDESSLNEEVVKEIPNWRADPSYIPLFNTESEKEDFEKHLKSIDYDSVDILFEKTKPESQINKKNDLNSGTKYSCTLCKKVFNSLSHVRMHCLTHTDLNPFICPKCPYRCNVKASLYTHMRTHTGNVFRCSQCNFQSNKRSHMMDHEQTHSTVKQICKLCKNEYKTLKSLLFHVKKYHINANGKRYVKELTSKQTNTFKCTICDKKFNSNSNLESHKKDSHSAIQNSNEFEDSTSLTKDSENILKNSSGNQITPEISYPMNQKLDAISNEVVIGVEPEKSFSDQDLTGCENSLNNSVIQTLPETIYPLSPQFGTFSNAALVEKEPKQPFSDPNSNVLESLLNDNNPAISTPEPINKSMNSFVGRNLPELPMLLNCSVMLEPLDHQLLNYHQYCYKCSTCNQPFSSKSDLENHELLNHSKTQEVADKIPQNVFEGINFTDTSVPPSLLECSVRLEPLDDQLVELMLKNLLEQKSTPSEGLFDEVFQQSQAQDVIDPTDILDEAVPPSTIFTECQNKLNILDDCFIQTSMPKEVINNATFQTDDSAISRQHQQPTAFNLNRLPLSFPNDQLMLPSVSGNTDMLSRNGLNLRSDIAEQKSVETKLFEKCRKAPAYVCCVCSSIFICTTTLKAHLKEHVNRSNDQDTFDEYAVNEFKSDELTNDSSSLNNVCGILQESDVENELEKLYTSSLHNMWYLPEVSVVLENDQSLIDSVLDDISNFPINDKFDAAENLQLDSEIFS